MDKMQRAGSGPRHDSAGHFILRSYVRAIPHPTLNLNARTRLPIAETRDLKYFPTPTPIPTP
jgi:hypothetical protein